jgi:hypothetical protein
MLSTVVSQNVNTAQVLFLIAVICGAVATVITLMARSIDLALLCGCATFVALGLLFFA